MTATTRTTPESVINQIETGRPTRAVLAAVRIAVGLMWLQNVNWKRPPDFGQAAHNGLYQYTSDAVTHPVLGAFTWVVQNIIFPNFALFGWGVFAALGCALRMPVLLLAAGAILIIVWCVRLVTYDKCDHRHLLRLRKRRGRYEGVADNAVV